MNLLVYSFMHSYIECIPYMEYLVMPRHWNTERNKTSLVPASMKLKSSKKRDSFLNKLGTEEQGLIFIVAYIKPRHLMTFSKRYQETGSVLPRKGR